MPDRRGQLCGETAGRFRKGPKHRTESRSQASTGAGVLLDEAPVLFELEDDGSIASRAEWQLALRVAASKGLSKSELLPKFLLYICEQQLRGKANEITEQRIGTQIFNRASNYDPGEDNIVRSYARLLRKRLEKYFEEEGREEPMRIIIPRGGYVPVFRTSPEILQASSGFVGDVPFDEQCSDKVDASTASSFGEALATRWRPAWSSVFAGVILGVLSTVAVWLALQGMQSKRREGPSHAVWAQLFQPNRNTLIIPADSGFGILQNLTGRLGTLEEYANGSYFSDFKPPGGLELENLNDLRQQRYTSAVDLKIITMLMHLPESSTGRAEIRYARNITAEDLKSSNAILLGSSHTNPWVSLFGKNLNFRLVSMPEVGQSFVVNTHPVGAEQARYLNGAGEMANQTYGVIDYLPSLDGSGHILILQGLNMAATQGAADMLFDSSAMKSILRQASLPDGSLRSFELLVETNSVGASAHGAQIIASRIYPR